MTISSVIASKLRAVADDVEANNINGIAVFIEGPRAWSIAHVDGEQGTEMDVYYRANEMSMLHTMSKQVGARQKFGASYAYHTDPLWAECAHGGESP